MTRKEYLINIIKVVEFLLGDWSTHTEIEVKSCAPKCWKAIIKELQDEEAVTTGRGYISRKRGENKTLQTLLVKYQNELSQIEEEREKGFTRIMALSSMII